MQAGKLETRIMTETKELVRLHCRASEGVEVEEVSLIAGVSSLRVKLKRVSIPFEGLTGAEDRLCGMNMPLDDDNQSQIVIRVLLALFKYMFDTC